MASVLARVATMTTFASAIAEAVSDAHSARSVDREPAHLGPNHICQVMVSFSEFVSWPTRQAATGQLEVLH